MLHRYFSVPFSYYLCVVYVRAEPDLNNSGMEIHKYLKIDTTWPTKNVLYFAKRKSVLCCIDHKVAINCVTVLYEPYSTVMHLIDLWNFA